MTVIDTKKLGGKGAQDIWKMRWCTSFIDDPKNIVCWSLLCNFSVSVFFCSPFDAKVVRTPKVLKNGEARPFSSRAMSRDGTTITATITL